MSVEWLNSFAATLEGLQITGGKMNEPLNSPSGFARAVRLLKIAKSNNKIIFIGNGASATIASHLAADFLKNGDYETLTFTDPALVTCVSNDTGYENVFALPLKRCGKRGDLLVAISSSGKSPNILRAVNVALELGMSIITFSGFSARNPLRVLGHLNFYVPSSRYGFVESAHLAIAHAILDVALDYKEPETKPTRPVLVASNMEKADG